MRGDIPLCGTCTRNVRGESRQASATTLSSASILFNVVFPHRTINLPGGKNLEALSGREFGLSRIRSTRAPHRQAREAPGWCSAGKDRTGVQFLLAKDPALGS